MKTLLLKSPAKLNLYLEVVNKRPDGYHNLITLFERIDLCDDIKFTLTNTGNIQIFCNHPDVPTGPKNLVYRVAQRLKDDFNIREGVKIVINKRIPVAAGLGGGSSNAATTILALNRLWGLSLSLAKMVDYAKMIGSDVPFFVYGYQWALGTGRGDQIKEVKIDQKLCHILVVPKVKMYTPLVYRALKLKLTNKKHDVNILIRSLQKNGPKGLAKLIVNDLETSILVLCPKLAKTKKRLEKLNIPVVAFSGSGPSLYGIVEKFREVESLYRQLRTVYCQTFIVRTL